MGLDMYLYAKRWSSVYYDEAFATKVTESLGDDSPPPSNNLKSVEVGIEVAYWRKANAIHAWLVRNVQDGIDDCREYLVEDTTLERLRDICRDLLTDRNADRAAAQLPTEGGFFFGNTQYDDNYWEYIGKTEEVLTGLLQWKQGRGARWQFYYNSSW